MALEIYSLKSNLQSLWNCIIYLYKFFIKIDYHCCSFFSLSQNNFTQLIIHWHSGDSTHYKQFLSIGRQYASLFPPLALIVIPIVVYWYMYWLIEFYSLCWVVYFFGITFGTIFGTKRLFILKVESVFNTVVLFIVGFP